MSDESGREPGYEDGAESYEEPYGEPYEGGPEAVERAENPWLRDAKGEPAGQEPENPWKPYMKEAPEDDPDAFSRHLESLPKSGDEDDDAEVRQLALTPDREALEADPNQPEAAPEPRETEPVAQEAEPEHLRMIRLTQTGVRPIGELRSRGAGSSAEHAHGEAPGLSQAPGQRLRQGRGRGPADGLGKEL
ncbi:hypothetical protein ACTVZO_37915 [Streptomyces sp. IBSNAI002]|uniref:hypothetical protein n=1 Tax=Streptomyces sp. IBSNAI002 TaxID=3457500 RepID=UPI003FD28E2C